VHALVGKAFVSLPRRQAAELARQQAEILGVGLAKPEPEIVEVPVVEPTPEVEATSEEDSTSILEEAFITEMIPDEATQVALPATEEAEQVALPGSEKSAESLPPAVAEESIPLPTGEPEIDNTSPIEREFRALIQELLDTGVDPSDMMTDPRLEEITERALAQNFETWPVFMQMVS
tara:strand:- start:186 stop:716 length:531 start_codon:yes stop_codon:yes gene_type:complete